MNLEPGQKTKKGFLDGTNGKRCSKCNHLGKKFYKAKNAKDGLKSQCTDCHYIYSQKSHKKFIENNPGYARFKNVLCKLRDIGRTPKWLTEQQLSEIKQFYTDASFLTNYTKTKCEVDHIVPLRGKNVCGLNVPWNLQILTRSDNARKHAKF